jgi:hypothetical protein
MRRALVLTDETARHPFRASLPQSSRRVSLGWEEPRVPWRERIAEDVAGFAQTYLACTLAVLTFIV